MADHSKYDLNISGVKYSKLNKNRAALEIVKKAMLEGITKQQLSEANFGNIAWTEFNGILETRELVEIAIKATIGNFNYENWFLDDKDLLPDTINNKTYIFSRQHGTRNDLDFETQMTKVIDAFPELKQTCSISKA